MSESILKRRSRGHFIGFLFFSLLTIVITSFVSSGCTRQDRATSVQEDDLINSETGANRRLAEIQDATSIVEVSLDSGDLLRFKSEHAREVALRIQMGIPNQVALKELLTQSTTIPSKQLQLEIQRVIVEELALISPESALGSVANLPADSRSGLLEVVFRVWSILRLDEALRYAVELEDYDKLAAIEGILLSRDDLSDEDRQSLVERVLGENNSDLHLNRLFLSEGIGDPETAWNEFISEYEHDLSQLTTLHIVQLANIAVALERDIGTAVFDKIEQDVPSSSIRLGVVALLLDGMARETPDRALRVVIEQEPEGMQFLATQVVSNWARSDPESALEAVERIEASGLRVSLQHAVLFAWIDIDPYAVMDEVEGVSPNLRPLVSRRALTSIALSSPERASEMLNRVEDYEGKRSVSEAIVTHWSKVDLGAALNWIRTSQQIVNPTMRQELFSIALSTHARYDPRAAFDMALEHQVDPSNIGPEAAVVVSIARRNFEAAIELLGRVRNGATRDHAIRLMGENLVLNGNSQLAIELSSQMREESRGNYLESLIPSMLHNDPGILADNVDSLTSHQARSRAASLLLMRYQSNANILTDVQIEKLKQYVID